MDELVGLSCLCLSGLQSLCGKLILQFLTDWNKTLYTLSESNVDVQTFYVAELWVNNFADFCALGHMCMRDV